MDRIKLIIIYMLISVIVYIFFVFIGIDPLITQNIMIVLTTVGILLILSLCYQLIRKIVRLYPNSQGQTTIILQGRMMAVGGFIIIFYIIFKISFLLLKNNGLSLLLTAVITTIIYYIMYLNAGKWEREQINNKNNRNKQFINNISPKENTCLSCFIKLDPEDRYCSGCGFDNNR